jgi:hypothetical protein
MLEGTNLVRKKYLSTNKNVGANVKEFLGHFQKRLTYFNFENQIRFLSRYYQTQYSNYREAGP